MRKLASLTVGLLALALLAGCSQAPAEGSDAAPDPSSDEPRREARGAPQQGDGEGDEPELSAVELLRVPLTMAGPGPESFDVTVPAGIVKVDFEFAGGPSFTQSGLQVELTGCGSYESGTGVSGTTGGGSYSNELCNDAAPGPATVTIAATLLVFDGTFILTGFTEAGNTTAPAQ